MEQKVSEQDLVEYEEMLKKLEKFEDFYGDSSNDITEDRKYILSLIPKNDELANCFSDIWYGYYMRGGDSITFSKDLNKLSTMTKTLIKEKNSTISNSNVNTDIINEYVEEESKTEYQNVVLKSANPEQYPDRVVKCRVIKREDIGNYIDNIPEEDKCVGCKSESVEARIGQVGEKVLTTLKTTYDGKDYILSEVENEVKETEMEDGTKQPDMIVTNVHSTSNEEYIVRANKFPKMYSANADGTFTPAPEPRQVAKLSENIVIETSWGEMAVGLNGSYIVTYDAERQSYNTIEKGAFESTYTIQEQMGKKL